MSLRIFLQTILYILFYTMLSPLSTLLSQNDIPIHPQNRCDILSHEQLSCVLSLMWNKLTLRLSREASMKGDHIGQKFGDYRLTRWLGGGGFGDVYLGTNVHDNTLGAVKVLQARLAETTDIKKFINE